jgi:hypothetical protein
MIIEEMDITKSLERNHITNQISRKIAPQSIKIWHDSIIIVFVAHLVMQLLIIFFYIYIYIC